MDEILKLNSLVFKAAGLENTDINESVHINIDDISDETIANSTGINIEEVAEEKIKIKEMMKATAFSTDPIMYVLLSKLNKSINNPEIKSMIDAIDFKNIDGLTGETFELECGRKIYVFIRPMLDHSDTSDKQFRKLPPVTSRQAFDYIIEIGQKLLGQFYQKYTNFYDVNKARLLNTGLTENTFIATVDHVGRNIVLGYPNIWFRVGIQIGIDDLSESDIDKWIPKYL
jgi:hypothetical protein